MQAKGWLRTNSTPQKASEIGGNPQKFVMAGDWLAPWIDEPEKYAKLKELLWFWREAYKGNNIQWCLNVCKLGGLTKTEILAAALAAAQAEDAAYLPVDGSGRMTGMLRLGSQQLTLSADADDLEVTRSILCVTPQTSARTITGILPVTGAVLKVENVGSQNLILANQSGSSDAESRIITGLGMDRTVAPGTGVMLVYDYSAEALGQQRWLVNN